VVPHRRPDQTAKHCGGCRLHGPPGPVASPSVARPHPGRWRRGMPATAYSGAVSMKALPPLPGTPLPDSWRSVREVFDIDCDLRVPAFREPSEHVPPVDPAYVFDHQATLAVLAGFSHNRRVLLQGLHGTGKSTHIEQIAARLNWPCLRLNLDSEITRL